MQDLSRLASKAREGDAASLDQFVRLIQADVWRFCVHLTRLNEADDLAQESLLRVIANLRRWERGPVMPWVLGVTRNVCFDHLRKRDRRRTDPVADPTMGHASLDQHSIVETVQLIAGLPMEQREALVLTQVIGLAYVDAADVVGCPVGTIRSRVARGRAALAEAMNSSERRLEG